MDIEKMHWSIWKEACISCQTLGTRLIAFHQWSLSWFGLDLSSLNSKLKSSLVPWRSFTFSCDQLCAIQPKNFAVCVHITSVNRTRNTEGRNLSRRSKSYLPGVFRADKSYRVNHINSHKFKYISKENASESGRSAAQSAVDCSRGGSNFPMSIRWCMGDLTAWYRSFSII